MPHCEPKDRKRRGGEALLVVLLAAGSTLTIPTPLVAQELALRAQTLDSQAQPGAESAIVVPYELASAGAVPDPQDTAETGLDDDPPIFPPDGFDQEQAQRPARAARATASTPETTSTARRSLDVQEDGTANAGPNRRARTLDSEERQPLDPRAERTGSIEGFSPRTEEDPYAPVGMRAGTFILRPSIEEGVTATNNADASPGGRSAVLSETTLRLNAASDWALHSATIDGYVTFRKSLSGQDTQDIRGRVDGTLNLELDHDWRATARLGYEAAPESASSPVPLPSTADRPLHQVIEGSLGIEKDVGKARLGLTGAVERDLYGDADLSGGGTLSQKDRNSTLYSATLRGGYAISPALTPFAEVEVGRRAYDERVDAAGYQRSADRLRIHGGTEFDLGEKLNGEFSLGWVREALDDDRLPAISGLSVDADIRWSPERGTTIGLRGTTTVEGTTTAAESGSILYSGRLTAERSIRSNLTANAALGADWRDYAGSNGHDRILSAEAGLTWWLNRYAGLTTRLRYETQTSNLPGRDYDATSLFLGLKVQR